MPVTSFGLRRRSSAPTEPFQIIREACRRNRVDNTRDRQTGKRLSPGEALVCRRNRDQMNNVVSMVGDVPNSPQLDSLINLVTTGRGFRLVLQVGIRELGSLLK